MAAITTAGSGNWSSTTLNAPWPSGTVPTSADTVTIANTHTVTVDGAAACSTLTINSGGTLTHSNSTNNSITAQTTIANNGMWNCDISSTPSVTVTISCNNSAAASDGDRDAAISVAKTEIDMAFSEAENSTGIILDLRNNGGGFELLSSYVAEHLVSGNFTYFELERQDSSLLRSQVGYRDLRSDAFNVRRPEQPRMRQRIRHFGGQQFTGPLVVLINERCFSTTDNLCACLQDLRPKTKFVGRPTNGGTGEPAIVDNLINSGAKIQLCVSRVYSPKGRMIEGTGTKPDLMVEPDRDSLLQGRDLAIEAAMNLLLDW